MRVGDYHELLTQIFGGRRWMLAIDVLAGATPLVSHLKALGAERCLCIATSAGAGPAPDPEFAPDPIVVAVEAPDVMTGIRRSLDQLADLPVDALAKVDAFDPRREARVIGSIFDDGRPVAGRTKYGARPAAWQALEDKTRIDAFWDAAGVARAPSRVVPVERSALVRAIADLDRGQGAVLAGDNREGFNGGATYVRWARGAVELDAVFGFFDAHCDRVRVMPFLEGIPCSVHGFVFDEHVIALRPCEMLVFRRPGSSELRYARAASFWDPSDADRAAMRRIAARTGEQLRQTVDYRGAFTVDGVMTSEGFLPTELNPRFGAALAIMTSKLDLPLVLLNAALVERECVDWQPQALKPLILEVADRNRAGGGMAVTSQKQTETRTASLIWTGTGFRIAEPAEQPDATAMLGPAAMGGFLKVELVPERTPIGSSVAGRVALALACLDTHFELGIGPLVPALDVRGAG